MHLIHTFWIHTAILYWIEMNCTKSQRKMQMHTQYFVMELVAWCQCFLCVCVLTQCHITMRHWPQTKCHLNLNVFGFFAFALASTVQSIAFSNKQWMETQRENVGHMKKKNCQTKQCNTNATNRIPDHMLSPNQ